MRGCERLECGDEPHVATELELRVRALLDRRQPQLLEPLDFDPSKRLEGEIAERGAPPERQGLVQQIDGTGGTRLHVRLPSELEETLEAAGVDLVGLDLDDIAARPRCQRGRGPERLSEARELDVEAVTGVATFGPDAI